MTPAEHTQRQQPRLKAFLDNELPPWRRFAVRLHLTRCASCREEMRAMQQIGEELRGRRIDPLDPVLRGRILATVREITPEPARPIPTLPLRRPTLIWGGAAIAALLVAVVFVPQLSTSYKQMSPMSKHQDMAGSAETEMPSSPASGEATPPAFKSAAPESTASRSQPSSGAAGGRAPSIAADDEAKKTEQQVASITRNGALASRPESGDVPVGKPFAQDRTPGDYKQVYPSHASPTEHSFGGSAFSGNVQAKKYDAGSSPAQPRGSALAGRTRKLPEGAKMLSPVGLIPLERAGFDLNGYRFVTQTGKTIEVPFKKSLNALRFARAADSKMALEETAGTSPVLYLGPADTLINAAVPEVRWQPLPVGAITPRPLYVRPMQNWEQFLTMRWYPKMTFVGGWASSEPNETAFIWLPGSHIRIGDSLYPDFASYRAFADAHPDAQRLRAVYDAPAPAASIAPARDPAKAAGSARGKAHP